MRYSGGLIGAGVVMMLMAGSLAVAGTPRNVVFFLVDDLGWADIGANNPNTFYETPNIDRFAASGQRFTAAYAACGVCSPTRASILAGQYPARMKTTDYFGARMGDAWDRPTKLRPAEYLERLPLEHTTLAEALKQHGYATFFAGKWHLGHEPYWPEHQGFDVNQGGVERGGPYGGKKYFSPYGNPRLEDGPDGEHLPDRLATETVNFITQHKDKPFLAYLSFYSVHTPLIGRPDLVEKYEKKRQALDASVAKWKPEHLRSARQVQDHAVYAAMVEAMDQAVGKVLAALDELDLADDTIVVFFSDNGGLSTAEGHPTSNLPFRAGKGWHYEGGIREPCIVRVPGMTRAGAVCDQPIISTDFYPTLLDLAGLPPKPDQHLDGVSFKPLLKDSQAELPPRDLFWHYPHYGNQGGTPVSVIRAGDFKLIEFLEDGHVELYNLADDPAEQRDLAASRRDLADQLRKRLHAWRQSVDAAMPTPNPNYDQKKYEQMEYQRDGAARNGKYS
jgi:arylsulfatase A-like enzyme